MITLFRYRAGMFRQRLTKTIDHVVGIPAAQLWARYHPADISMFFEFKAGPYGGGNQFLKAFWGELERRELRVENNTISPAAQACLFNSYNFDFTRLRRMARSGCRMVHRVDGPLTIYRGSNDESDRRIWQINQELADVTILQSYYSLEMYRQMGMEFKSPHVIMNAVDPAIFHARNRIPFDRSRKIHLIAASWSDNPNKGASILKWIEEHLDWARFEFTFVGQSPLQFERIRMLPPVPSPQLADLLRQHDIYIAASRHDPCSNALIEALSCGLPALYLNSGGHPEIVEEAGLGFDSEKEVPELLDRLVAEYDTRQAKIAVPTIREVADAYLSVMGVTG
ncbi:MAG: glycosyltransferase family 4 protein [Ardenticatenaceae bacterium]|nr:glycosyltransferase family 4 protein [Ardenticatenaceae bacterium]